MQSVEHPAGSSPAWSAARPHGTPARRRKNSRVPVHPSTRAHHQPGQRPVAPCDALMERYVQRLGSPDQRIYGNQSRDPAAFSNIDCVQAHIRLCEAWQGFKCRLCKEVALHQVNTTAAKRVVFVDCFYPFGDQLAAKPLATVRSPLPHTQDRKPRIALLDRQGMVQAVDPSRLSVKIGFEVPKHSL
jgi:hypothetical protein